MKKAWEVIFKIEMFGKIKFENSNRKDALLKVSSLPLEDLASMCEVKRLNPMAVYAEERREFEEK